MESNQLTKGQVRKLGDELRKNLVNPSEENLIKLQNYRTSHKDSLAEIFSVLNSVSKKMRPDSITTYRIKRIESILGKLRRYPTMQFDRMWDIAGCRCILKYESDVHKLFALLNGKFVIKKINDYYKTPQSSGYRSLHFYVSLKENDSVIIELQLRAVEDHNWATLVEIVDFVYEKKIKEGERNQELENLHLYLSDKATMKLDRKKQIVKIVENHDIYNRLRSIFIANYLEVRKQWMELGQLKDISFFIIESKKGEFPIINSFSCFTEAEEEYFNRFRMNSNANIVLTCLPRATYENISKAYSNYILTMHTFLEDYCEILSSVIVESVRKGKVFAFYKYYLLYSLTMNSHVVDVQNELKAISEYGNKQKQSLETKNWQKDFRTRFLKRNEEIGKLNKNLRSLYPQYGFKKKAFDLAFRLIRRKLRRLEKKNAQTSLPGVL